MTRRLIVLVAAVCLALTAMAESGPYTGWPLREALRDLESKGLRLIYSSDVVRPDMLVSRAPRSKTPRAMLDELLSQHRLRATDGPRGSLVIVRNDDRRSADSGEPASPATMPTASDSIVVTPSRFTIFTSEPERRQILSREEVRRVPHLGDDLYRAIDRLPGITGSDVSARFNVRGGRENEVEVLLDGAEIYDPFHIRDLFRAFSTIDAEAVGAVDVLTGGFPVQYGGRLSGVVDITSLHPSHQLRTEIGIGLLNTRVLSSGRFRKESAEWLFSIRRGYLRELLELVNRSDEKINPNYYDVRGKVEWQIGSRHVVSGNLFLSGDRIGMQENETDRAHSTYSDRYAWANLRSALTPRLFSQNVFTVGQLAAHRNGAYGTSATTEEAKLEDERRFEFIALKNDTSYSLSPRHDLKGGIAFKQLRARHDYDGDAVIRSSLLRFNEPPLVIDRRSSGSGRGHDVAAYLADRFAVTDRLVVEAGVRADRQSYTPDGTHLAPRLNLAYAVSDRAVVRAAWGRFYQPQGIHELQIEDGVTHYQPAERAEHTVLGVELDLGRGLTARGELYDKRFTHLHPRFENIFDKVVLFPELRPDRLRINALRARARGGELLLRKSSAGPLSGWISLGRATVEDIIDGQRVPRGWDQRNTLTFNVGWKAGDRWSLDAAGVYHSGWPTTPMLGSLTSSGALRIVPGALNSDRLPDYRRIDLRASRTFPTSRGGLSFFVELFNAFAFENVTRVDGFEFTVANGSVTSRRVTDAILKIVPSFGLTWAF